MDLNKIKEMVLPNGKKIIKLEYLSKVIWQAIRKTLSTVTGIFPLTLEKSTGENLVDYKIYGNSIQDGDPTPDTPIEVESVGEKSKNLINPAKITKYGTRNIYEGYIKVKKNTDYILWYKNALTQPKFAFKGFTNEEVKDNPNPTYDQILVGYQIAGDTYMVNTGDFEYISWREWGSSSTYGTETNLENYILEEGTTATDYEPYGYKIPVKVSSKNLFDVKEAKKTNAGVITSIIDNHLSMKGTSTGTSMVLNPLKRLFLEKGTYTISMSNVKGNISGTGVLTVLQTFNDEATIALATQIGPTYTKATFTLTESQYVRFRIIQYKDMIYDFECDIQLEQSTTATDYTPYFEPRTENIYLDEPLRKIDEYADYIDFKNSKVVRNIGILGTEELANLFYETGVASSSYIGSQYVGLFDISKREQFRLKKYFFGGYNSSVENKFRVLCNKLNALNSTFNKNYKYGMIGIDGSLNLYIGKTQPANTTEMAQRIRDLNIELILPLTTPTEESIELPNIPLQQGDNIIEIDTKIQPSRGELEYWKGL